MGAHKIMVVDDEPDFVEILSVHLKKAGYDIVPFTNGEEALVRIPEERPDLILLDIKMPKMDGYTFVRHLKKNPATAAIPLIVLTSYEPMKDMFLVEGVEDYFVKSFDTKPLLAMVDKLLNRGPA
ncbi:MAG: response regulator [Candidatus Omnitrophota bacterium]|jgi:CheY-like chemotaxis protein